MTVEVRVWLPREVVRGGAGVTIGTVDTAKYAWYMARILDAAGWTAIPGIGSWEGMQEGVNVVSILVDTFIWEKQLRAFFDYIRELRITLGQDAILVAISECRATLVTERS